MLAAAAAESLLAAVQVLQGCCIRLRRGISGRGGLPQIPQLRSSRFQRRAGNDLRGMGREAHRRSA